jgi:iron only hydrogenase large subunit-like protein
MVFSAQKFIESNKFKNFTFVEVMVCHYGCIGGGGQPNVKSR